MKEKEMTTEYVKYLVEKWSKTGLFDGPVSGSSAKCILIESQECQLLDEV
jgi:hypothetical protein